MDRAPLSNFEARERRRKREQRHWLRSLRKGDVVSACYDGKGGRAVRAVVIKQKNGVVLAEFPRWAGEGVARVRFVDGGGWDQGGETMPLLGVSQRGDWYAIYRADSCPPRGETASTAVVRTLMDAVCAELEEVQS